MSVATARPAARSSSEPMDQNLFRDVMGHFASGVTVITASCGCQDYGTTASAVSSLSLEPPMLLICLSKASETQNAVLACKSFAVNILGDDQADIALQFAGKGRGKFEGVAVTRGGTGAPLITGALAHLECRVAETATGGTHTVFMAEVHEASARAGTPLTYFRGTFGRFENALEEAAYRELRALVLSRRLPIGEPLDFDALASDLYLERPHVSYAVTKLRTDGLVSRQPGKGYMINPLDVRAAEQAFDARCAIEIAVADMAIGKVGQPDLDGLGKRVAAILEIVEGEAPDLDRFLEASETFHVHMVGFAKNKALMDCYQRLETRAFWTRTLRSTNWPLKVNVNHLVRVTEAYRAGDVEAAKEVLYQHTAQVKALAREAIQAAGGAI